MINNLYNINIMEKYLKYKKKYYYLKIQYAGIITNTAKKKVISSIFKDQSIIDKFRDEYGLLILSNNIHKPTF